MAHRYLSLMATLVIALGMNPQAIAQNATDGWLTRHREQTNQVLVTVFLDAPKSMGLENPRDIADWAQAQILEQVGPGFEPVHRYQAIPALTGWMDLDQYRTLDPNSQARVAMRTAAGYQLVISPELSGQGDPTVPATGAGALSTSRSVVNAQALQDMQFTGAGTRVAIIDTGIDRDNPDFFGRIVAEACFCSRPASFGGNCCPNQQASQVGSGSAEDDNGHGTNVSGIAAAGGTHIGMAPGAEIVSVKTIDNNNIFYTFSDQIAALDWLFSEDLGLTSVNMSLGTNQLFNGVCDNQFSFLMATKTAIDNLNSQGTAVIAAAGNQFSNNVLPAPACVSNAVVIGATNDADSPQAFSNTSALVDLFAPGVAITATGLNSASSTLTGTSMSTPHVAGGLALLAGALPAASIDSLIASLKSTGTVISDRLGNDIPRINLLAAYESTLASLIPSTPTITGLVPDDGQIQVFFDTHQLGDTGNNFYYEVSCTGGGQTVSVLDISSPILVRGLTNGVAYTCTIFAIGAGGNSPTSNPSGPVTPAELSATGLPIWLLREATNEARDQATE